MQLAVRPLPSPCYGPVGEVRESPCPLCVGIGNICSLRNPAVNRFDSLDSACLIRMSTALSASNPFDTFEIHVLPATAQGCRVYTRSSRFGEASSICELQPDAQWLVDTLDLLRDGFLTIQQLEQFGTLLLCGEPSSGIHGLLRDATLGHLQSCLGIAFASPNGGLRLCLKVEPPALAALPWEYLFDAHRKVFLATDPRVWLFRSSSATRPETPLAVRLPLRGLLIASSTPDLDLHAEIQALLSLQGPQANAIAWEVLAKPASVEAIHAILQTTQFHVLHFSGHGRFGQQGMLYLDENQRHTLSERALADLLLTHPSIRLVVLNACQTGGIEPEDGGGMAQRLLSRGIPAVVVMQRSIRDTTAVRFSRVFYQSLLAKAAGDVAEAMNLARAALKAMGGDSDFAAAWDSAPETGEATAGDLGGFGIPMLYLRATGTRLFELAASSSIEPNAAVPNARTSAPALPAVRTTAQTQSQRREPPLSGSIPKTTLPIVSSPAPAPLPDPGLKPASGGGAHALTPSPRAGQLRMLVLGCLLLLAAVMRWNGGFEGLDAWRQQTYTRWSSGSGIGPDVAIVDLGDDVEPWRWKRETLADLLEILLSDEANIRGLVLDVILSDQLSAKTRSDNPQQKEAFDAGNQRIADIVQAAWPKRSVVFAMGGKLEPSASVEECVGLLSDDPKSRGPGCFLLRDIPELPAQFRDIPRGFAALPAPDEDAIHETVIQAQAEGNRPTNFSLAAVGVAGTKIPMTDLVLHRIKLQPGLPWQETDPYYRIELPFVKPTVSDTYRISAAELLRHKRSDPTQTIRLPGLLQDKLNNKILVLGRYQASLDRGEDRVRTVWGERPGVLVQATLVAHLLRGAVPSRAHPLLVMGLQAISLLGVLAVWARRRSEWRRIGETGAIIGILLLVELIALQIFKLRIDGPVPELLAVAVLVTWTTAAMRLRGR